MWTRFMDMHSGGGQKLDWGYIYIEAPEELAKIIFYNKFARNPERVTCTCCGEDYSISSNESLSQLTGFDRGCRSIINKKNKDWKYIEINEEISTGYEITGNTYGEYITIEEYRKKDNIKFISKDEIKESECRGEVPQEGYVWMD